jgi:hypothetical protein
MKQGFTIHWNGPAAKCVGADHDRCQRFWAAVKAYHVNTKGWSDIAYSFGVCPHGIRFTGRGWYKNQFANGEDVVGPEDGADSTWYTVLVFLGEGEKPTAAMVDATRTLIAEGRRDEHCGTRVLPHNAFKVKTCPGPEFTAYAKVWDNAVLVRPATTTPTNTEDFDMDDEHFKRLVRSVLNEGTGTGLTSWADTEKRILSTVQGNRNLLNGISAAVTAAQIGEVVEAAVAAAVAADSPVDPQAVADAVVAKVAEKLAAE